MSEPIHQEVVLRAEPQRIYEALLDAKRHAAFTGGAATISGEAGGAFSCHDGQIEGRHIELVPGQRIVQAWRVAAWDAGVYSVVRFELQPEGKATRLVLDHAGVPEPFRDAVAGGWQVRYWEPLERYLG